MEENESNIQEELSPNEGKNLEIELENGEIYYRYPVKTKIVMQGDSLEELLDTYVGKHLEEDDLVFISEKIVAISQGRAFPIKDIKPSLLAKFLVRFVHKSSHGIGLGSGWTMQLAIQEVGRLKIIFVAIIAGIAKLFGKKGVFYKILGPKVAAIDGPCDYTLPPYNEYAKLAPKDPDKVALRLKKYIGHEIIIIDANDLGAAILGKSTQELDDEYLTSIFKDNLLGQASQQTPIAIVRKKSIE